MTPQIGQHVRCFMRSGMVLEGIVELWSAAGEVELKSIDGKSLMIVHTPSEDIMLTKIVLDNSQENSVETPPAPEPIIKQQIRETLQKVLQPTNLEIDQMNLEQLRQLVAQQDRIISSQKRKKHFGTPGSPKKLVGYSNPSQFGRLPRKV